MCLFCNINKNWRTNYNFIFSKSVIKNMLVSLTGALEDVFGLLDFTVFRIVLNNSFCYILFYVLLSYYCLTICFLWLLFRRRNLRNKGHLILGNDWKSIENSDSWHCVDNWLPEIVILLFFEEEGWTKRILHQIQIR